MTQHKQTRSQRWTDASIRKAILLPKPQGALEAMRLYEAGNLQGQRDLASLEIKLLRYIADHADLLALPARPVNGDPGWNNWLLIAAPAWLIDGLAQFDAASDDLEPDSDREHDDADREPEDFDDDPNEDLERWDAAGVGWAPDWNTGAFPAEGCIGPVVRRVRSRATQLPVASESTASPGHRLSVIVD